MKIFIGGSISIKYLDYKIQAELDKIIKSNAEILVGDAFGIDRLVQNYCYKKSYKNVTVYTSNRLPRNNVGNFKVKYIAVTGLYGREFYTQKDIAMSNDCDCGIMIWNGKSKGTFANIQRLKDYGKGCKIYGETDNV